ncbi:MAG: tRNA 2-thiouridine(34) synthase MnmA, partial [Cytophagales bacterium]
MENRRIRLLIALSGGKDSTYAAIKQYYEKDEHGNRKYDLVGVTMKTWDYATTCSTNRSKNKETGCCNHNAINDAREVAVKLGIPYMVKDCVKDFEKRVITPFVNEYLAGRTPNPCLHCNTGPKTDELLQTADELGCDYLVTGHYAQIKKEHGRYVLHKSKDLKKDQTYALWGLSQQTLSRMIFPLGHLTKDEVCTKLKAHGYDNFAKKPESYEICFIPDNDYRGFLKRRDPSLEARVKGGEFILENGEVVGHHEGYPFYTVGQRRGLNLQLGYSVYVTSINKEKNQITVGPFDALKRDGMYVHQLNMGKVARIEGEMEVIVKVRYNDKGHP